MMQIIDSAYLVDSNAFLWLLEGNNRLNRQVAQILEDRDSVVSFSVASIWELAIKNASGKLRLDFDLTERATHFGFQIIDITADDAVTAAKLPLIHRDPFDRMIAAQAQRRNLTVVTSDPILLKYGFPILWAVA